MVYNKRVEYNTKQRVVIPKDKEVVWVRQWSCLGGIPTSTYSNMTSVVSLAGLTLVYC